MSVSTHTFLIVGLGNPGKEFSGTRHNIGKDFIKWLAKKWGIKFKRKGKLYRWGKTWKGEKEVILVFPSIFMNESGKAVIEAIRDFSIPLEHLLVIHDDVDLPPGKIKWIKKGGSGGHKGVQSIQEFLQTQLFPRLRIGIGKVPKEETPRYVLEKFGDEERKKMLKLFPLLEEGILMWIEEGIDKTMSIYNSRRVKND